MKRWLSEMREGVRILGSRDFWAAFRRYWSSEQIAERMNNWAERNNRR